MKHLLLAAASAAVLSLGATGAFAQSGALDKAVGGYTFEDAAKESPDTKKFNSDDGKLTFAIVTHTAGNGFFDPAYVGAKVAAGMRTSSFTGSSTGRASARLGRSPRATSSWPLRIARSARSWRISDLAISRLVRSWPIS